jgi:hypothetical protein
MKKYILILMVAATVGVTSCGSGSTAPETTDPTVDSTSTKVDTTATPAVDTTVKAAVK